MTCATLESGESHTLPLRARKKRIGPYLEHLEAMLNAARSGDIDTVRALIPVCDPRALDSVVLDTAATEGHVEIVRMLIPVSDPKANDGAALCSAAYRGHRDVVRALIPVSSPQAHHSKPLLEAATAGQLDVVRELIPVSDPKADDSAALRAAAENGHLPIVRMLIPVSDPRAKHSDALRYAARGGHHQMVKELVPVSDALAVFRSEVGRVCSGVTELEDTDSINHVFIVLAATAVDTLAPHVGDSERDRALAELPSRAIHHMPQLRASLEAQALSVHLYHVAPAAAPLRRPRLST